MAHIAERIVKAIQAERLVDNTGNPEDIGYNDGIQAALAAVSEVAAEPDPLRELAEWLASKDWMVPLLEQIEGAPAEVLKEAITRACEALGRKEN